MANNLAFSAHIIFYCPYLSVFKFISFLLHTIRVRIKFKVFTKRDLYLHRFWQVVSYFFLYIYWNVYVSISKAKNTTKTKYTWFYQHSTPVLVIYWCQHETQGTWQPPVGLSTGTTFYATKTAYRFPLKRQRNILRWKTLPH